MFSNTYVEAREKFRDMAETSGYDFASFHMPENIRGPHGEILATDIAHNITPHTRKVLFVTSATHGVEGFLGSALQSQWLRDHHVNDLPADTAIVFVHAVNPHGFAHLRRVDMSDVIDGVVQRVDPNRNFMDFSKPLPANPDYLYLEDTILPQNFFGMGEFTTSVSIAARFALDFVTSSTKYCYGPLLNGQYTNPQGFSYGGVRPSWSNRVIHEILDKHVLPYEGIENVTVIDIHSGLGDYATINSYPSRVPNGDQENFDLVKNSLKDISNTVKAPYPAIGPLDETVIKKLTRDGRKISGFTAECGTRSKPTVLNRMRRQNCADLYNVSDALKEDARLKIKDAFYPQEQEWMDKMARSGERMFAAVFQKILGANIAKDIPKTNPGLSVFANPSTQLAKEERLERKFAK